MNTIQTEAENQLRAKGLIPEVVVDNHDSYAAGLVSVSYTHLDVYKRQSLRRRTVTVSIFLCGARI